MDLPQNAKPTRARVRSALLAAGLRITRQRASVYDHLLRLDHPTAEEVYREVQSEIASVSLATIYKALEALVDTGLADRMMTMDGSSRYDARKDHHYHLRCLRTGAVEDLETRFDPELIEKLDPTLAVALDRKGFHVTGYRLEVVGYFDDATPDKLSS